MADWPGRFEIGLGGYIIVWQVIQDRGETIILVRIEEEILL